MKMIKKIKKWRRIIILFLKLSILLLTLSQPIKQKETNDKLRIEIYTLYF